MPIRPAKLAPISETQHVLRVTVPQAFVDDLEAVRDALSHVIPDRKLEKVLHECIRRTLEQHARRRIGSEKTTRKTDQKAEPQGRYLPVEVRRQVWQRDEGRCAFVSAEGRRCGVTYKLEFHHVHPFAKGGAASVDNISARCASHNRFHAVMDFGSHSESGRLAGTGGARAE